ncbi:MAG: HD domain-containing protein, partial [Chlamydiae bacterium]|nr:HD domain-containing protein [Chlamydiota bacterium]
NIHQYGVAYYTTHKEEYTRYDHSLGVFIILRAKGSSLEEQIAGLLHDISHTVFSHVGDWIFGKEKGASDYQSEIHRSFLEKSGIGDILRTHHLDVEQILPKEELFPALENDLPNLCADRIDYNLQGAYHQGFITKEEALCLFRGLRFVENFWVSDTPQLMGKVTRFSLFMTQNCWGGPVNSLMSRWLAEAILRAVELGCLSYEEISFGVDQEIWEMLLQHEDPVIQEKMYQVMHPTEYFTSVSFEESDEIIRSKFRGINPWVILEDRYLRMTVVDKELAQEFERVQHTMSNGWPIKLLRSIR